MTLESPKQVINKSSKEVFDFLNDVKNFEKLMPSNISKFEAVGEDGFVFALSGMPEIALKKKNSVSPNHINLGAAGGKLDFNLSVDIKAITENSSEAQFNFNGEFNAMMAMMVKGPIKKMIETWVTNIPAAIQ